jgi:hypothetical protein
MNYVKNEMKNDRKVCVKANVFWSTLPSFGRYVPMFLMNQLPPASPLRMKRAGFSTAKVTIY